MLANRDASPAVPADQQTAPRNRTAADAAYGCVDWYLYDATTPLPPREATETPGVSAALAAAATTLLTGGRAKDPRLHHPS
jgi:hypothetical protein